MANALTFDIAGPADHDQIFALNYETFVEEIPQHPPNASKRLVDRFHDQNTYLVARSPEGIVGMVAVRAERPFSLDGKLTGLEGYLPPHRGLCEVRLLCVRAGRRRGPVFAGLMDRLLQMGRERGYDLAVISGTTRQLRLYRHMGFEAFGPEVGSPEARYQPMYMTMSAFQRDTGAAFARSAKLGARRRRPSPEPPTSFLPGPVAIHADVRRAFEEPPISHRSDAFLAQVNDVKERLRRLTGAERPTLLLGSGTLANDVVAGQIWKSGERGAVVVDGEFGARLADQATRWSIPFDTFEREWGVHWDLGELDAFLAERPGTRWLWLTLCETSTGALRDLEAVKSLCRLRGVELYLDAVSAIGAVPVNLEGVRMASAVSGKALGSFPGLGIVLHNPARPIDSIPRAHERTLPAYLDLALYEQAPGVPFTQSSNLVAALACALRKYDAEDPWHETTEMASRLRSTLADYALKVLTLPEHSSPAVTTIALGQGTCSKELGDQLRRSGFLVSYESAYLLERNWFQVCLMGATTTPDLDRLLTALTDALAHKPVHSVLQRS